MRKEQQTKAPAEASGQAKLQMAALIGRNVLGVLGQPDDSHRIEVRPLWEHHYRVNVVLRTDAVSAKIAHSFFLIADGDGNVVQSTPAITKHY